MTDTMYDPGPARDVSFDEPHLRQETALDFVITAIFPREVASVTAILHDSDIRSINDLMYLDRDDLKELSGQVPNTTVPIKLKLVQIKKLVTAQSWYRAQPVQDNSTWFDISTEALNDFVNRSTSHASAASVPSTPLPSSPAVTLPVSPAASTKSQVSEFQSTIKRDISHYQKLKEDQHFPAWLRSFRATVSAHGLKELLDETHFPRSAQEQELFDAKDAFLYNVLCHILHTSKSKKHVRVHATRQSGRSVFLDLMKDYASGTIADITAESLQREITNLTLSDEYSLSLSAFLVSWEHKVMDLEDIKDCKVDDNIKREWLTSAIRGHSAMYTAISNAKAVEHTMRNLYGQHTAARMSFEQFFDLIRSCALNLDDARKTAKGPDRTVKGAERMDKPMHGSSKEDSRKSEYRNSKWWIEPERWSKMSREDRRKHIKAYRDSFNQPKDSQDKKISVHAAESAEKAPSAQNTQETETTGTAAQNLLSSKHTVAAKKSITVDGMTYTLSTTKITYRSNSTIATRTTKGALVDSGANGGLAGSNMRVIETSSAVVDVAGIEGNMLTDLPLCTAAGTVQTTSGPAVAIFHQYAHVGHGETIHSSNQMAAFGLDVDEKPASTGGKQTIATPDGFVIPLAIRGGLAYMDMHPPTDKELDTLPYITCTSDEPWNPAILDNEADEQVFLDAPVTDVSDTSDANLLVCLASLSENKAESPFRSFKQIMLPKDPDYAALQPLFGWLPVQRIKNTIQATTQWYKAEECLPFRRHFRSRFPAANVPRLNETVATDTFFANTPAHDDGILGHGGATMVQLYVGTTSQITDIFPMSNESHMHETLLDFIRRHGAPNSLFSDNAKAQTGKKVQNILRHYTIADMQSEPHYQHQNYAERRIQDVKRMTLSIMDRTSTPSPFWLLCMLYVVYLLNHSASHATGSITPLERAHGQKADISALLVFRWWEPVYYHAPSESFPDTKERSGRWVGVAEHQGDALTYLILDDESQHVVARSMVRTALDEQTPNKRAKPASDGGEDDYSSSTHAPLLQSVTDLLASEVDPSEVRLPTFSPEELIGRTFVTSIDGKDTKATVMQRVHDHDSDNHQNIKFLVDVGDGEHSEIMKYPFVCDAINQHNEDKVATDPVYTYEEIVSHQGPLQPADKDYKGSKYNVKITWTDGTTSFEPLCQVVRDDPVGAAQYAQQNNLLDTPGWKSLRPIARRLEATRVNTSKTKSSREPEYKFGVRIPRNSKEADMLDKKNQDTKWEESRIKELNQLFEYEVFDDLGKGTAPPEGYKKIRVHIIYDCKHDLRRKSRCVADGHLTDPCSNSYSGVISLRTMRIALLVGELNNLRVMVDDIGNAYLEAMTQEKVYIVAGPEFGELEGHTLLIRKALYGLRTSGARFHDKLADTLRDMDFFPCKCDPDLWMRDAGDTYEYVCVYVDDLMAIMKDPQAFFDALTGKYQYKLKGVGEPAYHLGGNFSRNADGTLVWGARTYIQRMMENYKLMFGQMPYKAHSPLVSGDHPETDETPELGPDGIRIYQSMIGALQWCITLGRFDIACAVMTMSRFRTAPRKGHFQRLQRIYGYLRKMPDGAI